MRIGLGEIEAYQEFIIRMTDSSFKRSYLDERIYP